MELGRKLETAKVFLNIAEDIGFIKVRSSTGKHVSESELVSYMKLLQEFRDLTLPHDVNTWDLYGKCMLMAFGKIAFRDPRVIEYFLRIDRLPPEDRRKVNKELRPYILPVLNDAQCVEPVFTNREALVEDMKKLFSRTRSSNLRLSKLKKRYPMVRSAVRDKENKYHDLIWNCVKRRRMKLKELANIICALQLGKSLDTVKKYIKDFKRSNKITPRQTLLQKG